MTDLAYAQRLASLLWENNYKFDVPEWKAGDTMSLVLAQIDNMTINMIRKSVVRETVEKMLNR